MPRRVMTMRMRHRLTLAGLLAAALHVAVGASWAAEPFNIDVVLSLTGAGAFLGTAEQRALQQFEKAAPGMAGEDVGGRPVHFVFHDDQSSPQTAVQIATGIVSAKPAVVIGPALVALCNAIAPLVRRGPVVYCLSPGIYPAPGSFVFSISNATRDLAAAQLRYFRLRGLTRLALITSTDASGQDALRNVKELLAQPENKDLQLVAETTFNPTDVSASAQIERIKGANPQALIAWSTGAAIGTVFKAVLDAGLDIPVATTNGNMTYAQMRQYAGILPKVLYIPSSGWPRTEGGQDAAPEAAQAKQRFFAAFEGADPPDSASSFAWDGALLVVSALHQLGPDATAEQLRAYLAKLKGFAGVSGIYDFEKVPQRGLDDSSVVVTRWNPDRQVWDVVSHGRGVPLEQ